MRLNDLPVGRKACVLALRGGGEFQHRVLSMGLSIGCDVEVLHGDGGDSDGGAVIVRAGHTRLMLGHGMAEKVIVRPL
ncbi:MAG: ferrous iron transport protein A [Lentisphaerae bacterium]|nr:ferrous iron transport protein A [Lentisphaerota bacterium]